MYIDLFTTCSIYSFKRYKSSVPSHTVLYEIFDFFEKIGILKYIIEIYKLPKLQTPIFPH